MKDLDVTYINETAREEDWVICIKNRILYLHEDDALLRRHEVKDEPIFLFTYKNERYFLAQECGIEGKCVSSRAVRRTYDVEFASLMGVAFQLAAFYHQNQYCGVCGAKMVRGTKERSMVCPTCGYTNYPKICPASIAAILDRETDSILITKTESLGRMQALVAGFVEIGETYEECIIREIREETGLEVKNLRWWGNQPWGYGENLMGAFVCEVDGSKDVHIDPNELDDAKWIKRVDLICDEYPLSIGGKLMLAFKNGEL